MFQLFSLKCTTRYLHFNLNYLSNYLSFPRHKVQLILGITFIVTVRAFTLGPLIVYSYTKHRNKIISSNLQ